jgi:hypothetical protein
MDVLNQLGIGEDFGLVDVFELVTCRPVAKFKGDNIKRKYRIGERMPVEELGQKIDDGNHLTFNYLGLVAMSSLIAAGGLLTDSSTTIIASMLVSPLMGPILSICFGIARKDDAIVLRGLRNEAWGIVVSFTIGIVTGIIAVIYYNVYNMDLDSSQVTSRGEGMLGLFLSNFTVV